VLTPDTTVAQSMLAGLSADRVICVSASLEEVNGYLNAADFGFLLRDSDAVNRVAFPTKFAEYSLTGLKIVMKTDPPSCVAIAQSLRSYVSVSTVANAVAAGSDEREKTAIAARQRLGRRAASPLFARLYDDLARRTHELI
jgi:hypothetical protein